MSEYRILLHDEQAENDRLWCYAEGLRLKLEATRKELNEEAGAATRYWDELCDLENDLAEARVQFAEERRRHQESIDGWKHSWNCSREELAEARAIAVELARFVKHVCPYSWDAASCKAYHAIRPGIRKWLEGK